MAAYSLITPLYKDEFEIQFSIEVIDNLVFPPAWLLKINFIIDSLEKVYFVLTALSGKASSVTSSVVSSSSSVSCPGERPQRTEVYSLTSCGVAPHGSQWPRKQLVPLSQDRIAISSCYLPTVRLVLGTM